MKTPNTRPAPLKKGDKIAILSPAGPIDPQYVTDAAAVIAQMGWEPVIMPHTLGHSGNYAGTDDERFDDLKAAFTDPQIRAILCSRGGYGVVHLMDRLDDLPIQDDPKWVIGFSDISAMHALMASKGIQSIHASMAKNIALGPDNEDNAALFDILQGKMPTYTFPSSIYNHPGIAQGVLLGGNLAVLADLINTPYNIIQQDTILFIEDIAEPIYKIERILYQLRLSGVLPNLRGLIIGQFTDYRPDDSYNTMEEMIADMVRPYRYPIAFDAPIGHVDHNIPLVEGAMATLRANTHGNSSLIFWR